MLLLTNTRLEQLLFSFFLSRITKHITHQQRHKSPGRSLFIIAQWVATLLAVGGDGADGAGVAYFLKTANSESRACEYAAHLYDLEI